jgi:hypothetical protein
VHNFFATATAGRAGDCCVGKNAGAMRDRARAYRKIKIGDVAETHISSALSHDAEISSTIGLNKKICRAAPRVPSRRALPKASGGGAWTQNQVESLLFFFLCSNRDVVRIDSRLH